jgi:hypothetical protein
MSNGIETVIKSDVEKVLSRAGRVTRVVECLPDKHRALNSTPTMPPPQKR